jgi:DNA helicase II / ATP-dependent DNA helicase PcrA
MDQDILSGLTPSQKKAVSWGKGPLLVLAGPGSGKTRVITRRVACLIQQGILPRSILALTFTNKAAEEMRSRLKKMDIPGGSLICTFHSLCARLLREFSQAAGLPENFTIHDRTDQLSLVRDVLNEMDLDPKAYQPARLLRRIGRWKNELLNPDQVLESLPANSPAALPAEVFREYQRRMNQGAALDFDDLLMKTALLLKNESALCRQLSLRFHYILVDEYQDTNRCQFRIARDLACRHRNLFVTGDPDQSIYGWRGADIENILAFEKDFPEAEIIRLEDNFRSTPPILDLADGMIQANRQRKSKRLISRIQGEDRPRIFSFADEYSEADGAAAWIKEMQTANHLDLKDMAIFYRTNAMSRILEETLYRKGIAYQIVRGLEFYQRREIKDMLAYLRILVNPADRISLLRIINRPPRGIGKKTIERLTAHADSGGTGLWPLLMNPDSVPSLHVSACTNLRSFSKMIRSFQSMQNFPVAERLQSVFKRSGYQAYLEDANQRDIIQNVEELIHSAEEYDQTSENPDLAGYLQQIALLSDPDTFDDQSGAVSLMTLHSAKGLEFPAVLITGVEKGILPHSLSQGNLHALEEERRLLFVGITRAKKYLALSYAQSRSLYGTLRPSGPSPFIQGLDKHMQRGSPGTGWSSPDSFPAASKNSGFSLQSGPYASGRRIKHPQLGEGIIDKVVPGTDPPKLVVQFTNNRRLTLDLRFAKIELV